MSTEMREAKSAVQEVRSPVSTATSSAATAVPSQLMSPNVVKVSAATSSLSRRDRGITDDGSQEGNAANRKLHTPSSSHISGPASEDERGNVLGTQRDNPNSDPKNLIVNYIPTPVTDEVLRGLFSPFGEVESARIIVDKNTNHPKGYGFVKFSSEKSAREAIRKMNGYEIQNKRLRVTQANGPVQHQASASTSSTVAAAAAAPTTQTNVILPTYSGATPVFSVQPAPVLVANSPIPPSFVSYPAVTSGGGFAFLPAAAAHPPAPVPPPSPQQPQQVYFAATPTTNGYQIHPQPLTFVSAGGTIIAQPVVTHGSNPPIIYMPASPPPSVTTEVESQTMRGRSQSLQLPAVMSNSSSTVVSAQMPADPQAMSAVSSTSNTAVASPMQQLNFLYAQTPSTQPATSSMQYSSASTSYSLFNPASSMDPSGQGFVVNPVVFPTPYTPAR